MDPQVMQPRQTNGLAVASLVCGILGFFALPVVGSILAIVFGYSARGEIDRRPGEWEGRGLAVAGIVLGWIGILFLVLAFLVGFLFLVSFS